MHASHRCQVEDAWYTSQHLIYAKKLTLHQLLHLHQAVSFVRVHTHLTRAFNYYHDTIHVLTFTDDYCIWTNYYWAVPPRYTLQWRLELTLSHHSLRWGSKKQHNGEKEGQEQEEEEEEGYTR